MIINDTMKSLRAEYRQKHPNCEWCAWYSYHSPSTKAPFINCADYATCELKDTIIKIPKLKAKTCNEYLCKEEVKNN